MRPEKLRILMTTDAVGGVWVFASTLAQALATRDCEILLVTLGPPPRREQLAAVEAEALTVRTTGHSLEWMDPEGRDHAEACFSLEVIAREFSPDLVHLNGFREALAQWDAPVLITAHSCVRSWWQACRGHEPDEPRWDRYVTKVRAGLAVADAWAAPTAAFRDCIEALYEPPTSGHVVWNGVEPVGSQPKDNFVLTAGRLWDEAKNVSALASIACGLDWPLRVSGATNSTTNTVDLPSGVAFLGELSRPALLEQARRAGIYVAPALYEPFGLAILEAASAGCALVLADIPSLRELWDGAALFNDPHDTRAIAQGVNGLCANDELRTTMQHAARRRAAAYRLSDTASSYQMLYNGLLGDKRQLRTPQHRLEHSEMRA